MIITSFECEHVTRTNYWILIEVIALNEPNKVVIQEYKESCITWGSTFTDLDSARTYFKCLRNNNFAKQDALKEFQELNQA